MTVPLQQQLGSFWNHQIHLTKDHAGRSGRSSRSCDTTIRFLGDHTQLCGSF